MHKTDSHILQEEMINYGKDSESEREGKNRRVRGVESAREN